MHVKRVADENQQDNDHHGGSGNRLAANRRNSCGQPPEMARKGLAIQDDMPDGENDEQQAEAVVCGHPSMTGHIHGFKLIKVIDDPGDRQTETAEHHT